LPFTVNHRSKNIFDIILLFDFFNNTKKNFNYAKIGLRKIISNYLDCMKEADSNHYIICVETKPIEKQFTMEFGKRQFKY
tara:strand:- start:552 stop:791 length:240 start_codon:yes stop_codon:yes gene_type:complete